MARSKKGICLNQGKYALELIVESGLAEAKPYDTPMTQNMRLATNEYDATFSLQNAEDVVLPDATLYKILVDQLIYLTITRPDMCYTIQVLSQFTHEPKMSHMEAALRVVRYLKQSPCLGILLIIAKQTCSECILRFVLGDFSYD